MCYELFDEREARGRFEVYGNGRFAACELVAGGVGVVGCCAVETEDGGAVVGEEEACEGT
jgi:hypothetical protein